MDVSIIFNDDYTGLSDGIVWIIDTVANRAWFDEQGGLDPASAVFSIDHYPVLGEAIIQIVWNAQEHTPGWSAIEVIGAPLLDRVAATLTNEGRISTTPNGFRLDRL